MTKLIGQTIFMFTDFFILRKVSKYYGYLWATWINL